MATDFRILAAPRISIDTFIAILKANDSPAAPVAATCYRAIIRKGVDPALALAVFQHESTYGKNGAAVAHRNWGNLRTSPHFPSPDGSFVEYPSWAAGAADTARLLQIYGANMIRKGKVTDSARTFPRVWAPSKDGNRPKSYGEAIVARMQHYLAREHRRHPDGVVETKLAKPGEEDVLATPVPPPPGTTRFIALTDNVRLRHEPNTDAKVARTVRAGAIGAVTGTVTGSPYEALGHQGTQWIRIVAVGRPKPLTNTSPRGYHSADP